ncbi:sensor histidine kinase [Actinocorallia sp. A-T 12471]|uniref:sensor histidine kinase n=1 Tax=Actinocorallia sp. A-T 12471 TaxID=3089813 RepID=UPI0029CAD504|nr:sensor histidine kinase [Actinocorallia sp. A-T 12471]MDX6743675.1 sensor histidine kinase [Actinocorallia sp. A-T 12471]
MTGAALQHQALLYGKDEEYLATAVPYVREGLDQDAMIIAAIPRRCYDAVRDVLGDVISVFADAEHFYRHPVRTISQYMDIVRTAQGRPVRALAEVAWQGRAPWEAREWGRYESLVNTVFDNRGVSVICSYDRRVIGEDIESEARRTHPQLLDGGMFPAYNDSYEHTEVYNSRCDKTPLPPVPADAARRDVTSLDLAGMRAFVKDHCTRSGMSPLVMGRFITAINEIATNALTHGTPPVQVILWTTHDTAFCEVADIGLWHPDELESYLPPESANAPSFGLWSARMLVDLVEIRAGWHGTQVRLRTTLTE